MGFGLDAQYPNQRAILMKGDEVLRKNNEKELIKSVKALREFDEEMDDHVEVRRDHMTMMAQ